MNLGNGWMNPLMIDFLISSNDVYDECRLATSPVHRRSSGWRRKGRGRDHRNDVRGKNTVRKFVSICRARAVVAATMGPPPPVIVTEVDTGFWLRYPRRLEWSTEEEEEEEEEKEDRKQ